MLNDTIVAVSTPRGRGGVALLRISGDRAVEIAERVFRAKNGRALTEQPVRTAVYGQIFAPNGEGEWQSVDDGIATLFRAPASFTGEDTVELCCHGGILLTETVLTACLVAGAVPAAAGEFTRRAVLNGKMGLSSAEALGNLLEADTHEQIALAHAGLHGLVEARTEEIYQSICNVLASIYVKIDYPDEDLADMSREEITEALAACKKSLVTLSASYRTGHAIAEGIPTVICGRPNVGKSSLYNCIVGHDAAIVTDVEGTTRDILCETAALGRVTLRLFDTAGLHETTDPVERIGVARAEEVLARAELVLAVFDPSQAPSAEERDLIVRLSKHPASVVAVMNKCDRAQPCFDEYASSFAHAIPISTVTGEGMEALTACIEQLFVDGGLDIRNDAVLTNARQHAAAVSALESVRRALDALRGGYPIDLCCADAEAAMAALAELDGRAVSEDIVTQIFSHFCVGK